MTVPFVLLRLLPSFHEFWYGEFFNSLSAYSNVCQKSGKITGTLHGNQNVFLRVENHIHIGESFVMSSSVHQITHRVKGHRSLIPENSDITGVIHMGQRSHSNEFARIVMNRIMSNGVLIVTPYDFEHPSR